MAKKTKTNRTQIKDLPAQQALAEQEMKLVKGGKARESLPAPETERSLCSARGCMLPKDHASAHMPGASI